MGACIQSIMCMYYFPSLVPRPSHLASNKLWGEKDWVWGYYFPWCFDVDSFAVYPAGKLWQLLLFAHLGLLTLCSTGTQGYAFTDSIERTSRAPTLYLQNNVDRPPHFILIHVKHYQCCFMCESCISIPFLLFQQTDGSCYFLSLIFCILSLLSSCEAWTTNLHTVV